jgi:hypothetical protein
VGPREGKLSRYTNQAMNWTTKESGFDSQQRQEMFSSPQRPDRLSDPSSPLYNGYRGMFLPGVKGRGCEADLSPPSSDEVKNGGAIPPLPHTSSWCGA